MMFSSATNVGVGVERRAHDDPAAGEALADVVVGVAVEAQRDAPRHEGAEALAGRPGEGDLDGVVGQAGAAVALGDLVAEHRADGAVDVADRQVDRRPAAPSVERRLGQGDQLVVEGALEAVVLRAGAVAGPARTASSGWWRIGVRSRPLRLPVVDGRRGCRAPRRGRWPRRGCGSRAAASSSRTSSAMYSKKFSTNSGLPVNRSRSSGFCVATPTGQVSRWQTRIMMQPDTTSGAVAKPNSSAPSSAAMIDVAAGLQLAVGLHDDAVAQAVEQQRLLGLGQAELPRCAGVLQRVERAGAGAAVVAGDEHDVGLGLRHAGGHGADADLGHQLHVDAGGRVGVLQVVDELLEILDRVDVVVRRRARSGRRPAWSAGSWRSTGTPCRRAAGRPRRAWRPGPS